MPATPVRAARSVSATLRAVSDDPVPATTGTVTAWATAGRIAEYLCRVVVAYVLIPAPYVDPASPTSVATFYSRHIYPAVSRMAERSD